MEKEYHVKNKDGKEIFRVIDAINDKMNCGCGNLLLDAKFCQICAKNVCKDCHEGRNKCTGCGEEMEDSIKLNMLIGKLICRCIYCDEELKIQELDNHPQSEAEHQKEICEGCSMRDERNAMRIHQQTCGSYLLIQNKKLKTENEQIEDLKGKISALNENNKRLNENVFEMKDDLSNLNKKLKVSVEENLVLKNEVENLKLFQIKYMEEREKAEKEKEQRIQEKRAVVGFKMFFGIEYPNNQERAKQLCEECMLSGSRLAEGMKHHFGWNTTINFEKAFKIFSEMVESDKFFDYEETSYCLYFIGCYYQRQNNFTNGTNQKEVFKAIQFYKKAVQLKNPSAMTKLALIYQNGSDGLQRNIYKAIELYKKAIDLNDSSAMHNLALMYEDGAEGVKKDIQKAIQLYKKAIELNDSSSMNNLGYIYQHGNHGIQKDLNKAIQLYKKSVESYNPVAISNLAHIYEHGSEIVPRDIQKAIELYKKAVELNYHYAIINLANIYEFGIDIPKDTSRAIELYKKASDLGNQFANDKLLLLTKNI